MPAGRVVIFYFISDFLILLDCPTLHIQDVLSQHIIVVGVGDVVVNVTSLILLFFRFGYFFKIPPPCASLKLPKNY